MTAEVQEECRRRYGGPDGDASPIDPAEFVLPRGMFLAGYVDGAVAAMGGWRRGGPAGPSDAEIKRMYVRPALRGRGYSRVVLTELERTAAAAGITRLVLETGLEQPEAIALYRSCGYESVEPFGFYAGYDDSVHLAKRLESAQSASVTP
ncbi:GNAT family N-acetyltransferase [Aeromicrobium sp. YIM 150415]|uniref:GNAT family N-acetyltransferase n=1 Tax=Aeromicrobium sp. YIM 150415 TaxID=2803912 RepID=UPI001963F55A|nr:GNAT family N-acetyltransferase [Aeromicrobium sp. YIM 150415]MBM9462500.1 GNAT family N-acetyltransferase [Aeromicrobium sp. YIM 150415]